GNGDGAFNGSDAGVGSGAGGANNVPQTLTLTGNDLNGNPVSITTTTDASGQYNFTGVPPGTSYTVTCTTCAPPAGFLNSTAPLAWPGSTGGTARSRASSTSTPTTAAACSRPTTSRCRAAPWSCATRRATR
ncbi:MAG: SdrD B-like domain-containing protein, partial [Sphingopyxis sp.]